MIYNLYQNYEDSDNTSIIGVAKIARGIKREVKVASLNPYKAVVATISPIKLLPESPIYILAGGKL